MKEDAAVGVVHSDSRHSFEAALSRQSPIRVLRLPYCVTRVSKQCCFGWVRPMNRDGSRIPIFVLRIPADVMSCAVGTRLAIPLGNGFKFVTVSARAQSVRFRSARPMRTWKASGLHSAKMRPLSSSIVRPPHSRASSIAFGPTARIAPGVLPEARRSPACPLAGGHERARTINIRATCRPSAAAESPALGATDIDDLNSDFPGPSIMQGGNLDRLADASFLDRFNKIRKSANLPAICLDNNVAYCAG